MGLMPVAFLEDPLSPYSHHNVAGTSGSPRGGGATSDKGALKTRPRTHARLQSPGSSKPHGEN